MTRLYRFKNLFARWCNDTHGGFAVMGAVSVLALIIVAGAGYDLTRLSQAKALAQDTADSMALSASIAVTLENKAKFKDNHTYPYTEISITSSDFTDSISGKVQYDLLDLNDPKLDENGNQILGNNGKPIYEKLVAQANVTGTYKTAFMNIIGIKAISFRANADVAYTEDGTSPASLFFVVDNSNSMNDYSTDGTVKLAGLKQNMKDFMDTLNDLPVQNSNTGIFRTALYPFSANPHSYYPTVNTDGLIPSTMISPKWGSVTDANIDSMVAISGTDSSGALQKAADNMAVENQKHASENGENAPQKYLIFMTDGANNSTCEAYKYSKLKGPFWYHVTGYYKDKLAISYKQESGNPNHDLDYNRPPNSSSWKYYGGGTTNKNYSYCEKDFYFDQRSLAACDQMKTDDVKIYTIAYDIDSVNKARANAFLKQCSSGDDYFKTALNAADLEQAFKEIGESVISEVIRIKS